MEAEGGRRELGWAAAGWAGLHAACTVHEGFQETLHSEQSIDSHFSRASRGASAATDGKEQSAYTTRWT